MSLSKFQITTKPAVKLSQPWWEVSRVPALLLMCYEEPATTVALVSTFTGVPSTTGSPANLSSKISMDQRCLHARGGDGTPHHHHPVYQSASKSVRPPCPGCFHPRPASQRCSHHCPARLPCLHCTGLQSVLSAPVFQLNSPVNFRRASSESRRHGEKGGRRRQRGEGGRRRGGREAQHWIAHFVWVHPYFPHHRHQAGPGLMYDTKLVLSRVWSCSIPCHVIKLSSYSHSKPFSFPVSHEVVSNTCVEFSTFCDFFSFLDVSSYSKHIWKKNYFSLEK